MNDRIGRAVDTALLGCIRTSLLIAAVLLLIAAVTR